MDNPNGSFPNFLVFTVTYSPNDHYLGGEKGVEESKSNERQQMDGLRQGNDKANQMVMFDVELVKVCRVSGKRGCITSGLVPDGFMAESLDQCGRWLLEAVLPTL